ncbi:alpha/beta hydrolase, partial [Nonomuraea sp. NN258]|uniref:alpha/beta fold hydrolase n=1 Tax=Nonomuraea antri TaxID=2730852 RepID=UPI0038B2852C|nr:alpha/beta hydrolase [Nonomuraea antri]
PIPADYQRHLSDLVAAGRRGAAVRYFMRRGVNLPAPVVAMMPLMPAWSKLKAVAHTLPYDAAFVTAYERGLPLPAAAWASITATTLVIDGGKSPAWMRNGVKALASVLPGAAHRTLEGQTHIVKPEALAPVLKEFFA